MILTQYTVRVFFLLELPTPFFQRVPGAYIRLLYRAYKKKQRDACVHEVRVSVCDGNGLTTQVALVVNYIF